MIFTEPVFLIFFLVTFGAYWFVKADFSFSLGPVRLTGHELRLTILLLASAVFYGWWDWRFLGLIGFVIAISWLAALRTARLEPGSAGRRAWLVFAIGANLAVLAAFKYFGFFSDSAAATLTAMGLTPSWPVLNILLPVGISFYIFQAISYIVDTARGTLRQSPASGAWRSTLPSFPSWWPARLCGRRASFPRWNGPNASPAPWWRRVCAPS